MREKWNKGDRKFRNLIFIDHNSYHNSFDILDIFVHHSLLAKNSNLFGDKITWGLHSLLKIIDNSLKNAKTFSQHSGRGGVTSELVWGGDQAGRGSTTETFHQRPLISQKQNKWLINWAKFSKILGGPDRRTGFSGRQMMLCKAYINMKCEQRAAVKILMKV